MKKTLFIITAIIVSGCHNTSYNNQNSSSYFPPTSVGSYHETPSNNSQTTSSLAEEIVIKDKFGQETNLFTNGEEVTLELRLTNNTNTNLTYSATGPGYEFYINRDNTTIWSSFYGMVFAQVITDRPIAANQTLVFTQEWTGMDNAGNPVESGEYTVVPRVTFFFAGQKLQEPNPQTITLN